MAWPAAKRCPKSAGLGVAEQTYYRWRKEYGGLKVEQARRFKELERENLRLRRAIAILVLPQKSGPPL